MLEINPRGQRKESITYFSKPFLILCIFNQQYISKHLLNQTQLVWRMHHNSISDASVYFFFLNISYLQKKFAGLLSGKCTQTIYSCGNVRLESQQIEIEFVNVQLHKNLFVYVKSWKPSVRLGKMKPHTIIYVNAIKKGSIITDTKFFEAD